MSSVPENRPQHNDDLARISVCQGPHKGRRDHIKPQERAGKICDLRVGQVELILDQRLNGIEDIAVRIVEEVQRRENDQRGSGMEVLRGHRSSEYSMTRQRNRYSLW